MKIEKAVFCISVPNLDPIEGIEYLEHVVYIGEDMEDDSAPAQKFFNWEEAYEHASNLANRFHLELVTERLD